MPSKTPRLIIIPGSVASEANWLDQRILAEKLGFDLHFVHLHKYRRLGSDDHHDDVICSAEDLQGAADNVYGKLENIFKEESDRETIIVSHSLGGMFLLKILHDLEKYQDSATWNLIFNSKVIFTQVPLDFKEKVFNKFDKSKELLKFLTSVNRKFIYQPIDKLLTGLKKISEKPRADLVLQKQFQDIGIQDEVILFFLSGINLFLNLALMHNTFWSVEASEAKNVLKQYQEWQEFSLDKVVENFNRQKLDPTKFLLTTGDFDLFCDMSKTDELATKLGIEVKHFPWSFHSPQHITWSQFELNKLIFGLK